MPNVKQETELYVITPDEHGILGRVMGTLANAGVNLKAIYARSERGKGIFFLMTSDNKKAEKALKGIGYEVTTNNVVTVEIDDRIGAGAEVGALIGNAAIDIDYCYGTSAGGVKVLLVFQTNDNKKAFETLR
ncbi:MAG: ACT domain-containing protein [Candidatus Aminicenantes bacterium]|nr:MAG: ACT domain-containing protein [Candidatus Aminicenantes bacterium]